MTNQASEDIDNILFEAIKSAGRYDHRLTADEADYIQEQAKAKIESTIRTEKLKLLDEVRERQIPVIALKAKKPHDEVQIQAVPIESLSELEAEL